jgi:hypothetical protein
MNTQALRGIAMSSCLLMAGTAHAETLVYFDQAAFVADAGSLSFDSYEDLEQQILTPAGAIARDGYEISSSVLSADSGLYVFDVPTGFGAFATDGDTFLVHQTDAGERLRFDFDTPINSFGLSITDWDNPLMTSGARLVFGNDAGDKFEVIATPQLDGEVLFFGIVNPEFAFTYVEFGNDAVNEAYGFDSVYFGSQAPVPLPAAAWLLLGALSGLATLRRKNSAQP